MELEAINWEQDLPLDADEAYQSLVRSLRRTDGFALLFVRCSPVQGDQIIDDVHADLPSKTIEVLELKESIDNLYDHVAALSNRDQINVLFVRGIEYSIFAYEDREMHDINLRSQSSGYGGTWQGIPRVLGHLNLSRERFRDNFKFCFIFLLPEFALRYFIRRAPDFFDWRSNIYEFPTDKEIVNQEAYRLAYLDGDYDEYCEQTHSQRIAKLSSILSYLDENPDPENEAALWLTKGLIHRAGKEYEEALISLDKSLQIKTDDCKAWNNKGIVLKNLARLEEAIICYEKALEISPDYHQAWGNLGNVFRDLSRHEEAIASYDKSLAIKPDYQTVWNNRGVTLRKLGRHEEAITSFDRTLEIKPDNYQAWGNRGYSLKDLGKLEEAIMSFDKVLEIKPESYQSWGYRGSALSNLGRHEEAIASYDMVLTINPDDQAAWKLRGNSLKNICRYEEAIASYDKALQFKSDDYQVWNNRGSSLKNLGRHEEAIASYDKVLKIKRDYFLAWHNRGNSLRNLGRHEEAIYFDRK